MLVLVTIYFFLIQQCSGDADFYAANSLIVNPLENEANLKLLLEPLSLMGICNPYRQYASLGHCSQHFIECSPSKNNYSVRKCAGDSMIFTNGRCKEYSDVPECQDKQMIAMSSETKQLVEKDGICSRGPALYLTTPTVTRQALICPDFSRRPIIVSCAYGFWLSEFLECLPITEEYKDSTITPFFPVRQHFIRRHCDQLFKNPYVHYGLLDDEALDFYRQDTCSTWFIDCSTSEPTIVQCSAGELFDHKLSMCREWTKSDLCPARGMCVGKEWQSFPLKGSCSDIFVRCIYQEAQFYQCPPKTFFDKKVNRCVVDETCNACILGQKIAINGTCNKYKECKQFGNITKWQKRRCRPGRAFNEYLQKCQNDYTCALDEECQPGDIFPVNCYTFALCNNFGRFDWLTCPVGTGWDPIINDCVISKDCKRPGDKGAAICKNDDVITTSDCKTFQKCTNDEWKEYSCLDDDNIYQMPCALCAYEPPTANTTVGCKINARKPHDNDCFSYYECNGQQFQLKRCENSWFDAEKMECTTEGTFICSNGSPVECKENELLVPTPNCGSFLQCKNGQWVKMVCPNGTIYDKTSYNCVSGSCEKIGFAEYHETPKNTYTLDIPSNPPTYDESMFYQSPKHKYLDEKTEEKNISNTNVVCFKKDRLVDNVDCTRFYECTEFGRYALMQCDNGYYYSAKERRCVEGKCGTKENNCKNGWYLPQEQCGHYKICNNNKWLEGRCANSVAFVNGICDPNSKCKNNDPYAQRDCQFGSVRPHPRHSEHYWLCELGGWVEKRCSDGKYFDWEVSQCLTAKNEKKELENWCWNGETRKHPSQCGIYEICNFGQWYTQQCEFGYGFAKGRCIPGLCDTAPGKPCKLSTGQSNYRLDPESCDHFYQCAPTGWTKMPCAPGTVFNPKIAVCDWPRNVPYCNARGNY